MSTVGYMGNRHLHDDPPTIWDPGKEKISIPPQVYALMVALTQFSGEEQPEEESRTELDLHAIMLVVGRHCVILSDAGKTVDVSLFTPDYKAMTVRLVDASVAYDCPYTGTMYILVIRNALYVPSMKGNLIPPFIL